MKHFKRTKSVCPDVTNNNYLLSINLINVMCEPIMKGLIDVTVKKKINPFRSNRVS